MDLNIILQSLGEFGKYQCVQYCISLIPCILYGVAIMSPVFLLAQPDHRCFVPNCDNQALSNDFKPDWTKYAIPESSKGDLDKCTHYQTLDNNLTCTNSSHFSKSMWQSCNKYVYAQTEFISTVTSKFNLVCDQDWQPSLATSFIYIAVLVAALTCGRLSDTFGRRAIFTWSPAISIASMVGAAFAPNFIVFTLLLAMQIFCMTGMNQDGFVIGMELVGSKYRTICGSINLGATSVGQLMLAGLAYSFRDTQNLQLAIATILCILLPLPWLLRESVRWCVSNGKGSDALATLQMAAKWNDTQLPEGTESTIAKIISTAEENAEDQSDEGLLSAFKDPLICRWTLNLLICWVVNNLVYFALAFQAGSISKSLSIYASSAMLGAIEIPFIFLMTYVMDTAGRKPTLICFMLAAGLSCLVSALFPSVAVVGGVLGKGFITASCDSLFVYTIEIYPTKIRGSIIGTAVSTSRIGVIAAPHVLRLKAFGDMVPLMFCGILTIISGLLVIDLPETLNKPFVETMEDAKNLKKKVSSEEVSTEAIQRKLSQIPLDRFPYNYPQFMLSSRRNTLAQPKPSRRHTIL